MPEFVADHGSMGGGTLALSSDRHVAFVLGTTLAMEPHLAGATELVARTLLERSQAGAHTLFNIVEFNGQVTRWCERMVPCTPRAAREAVRWLRSLRCRPGSDGAVEALRSALSDADCDAVCLLVAAGGDAGRDGCAAAAAAVAGGRPVHVVCVLAESERADGGDRAALERLARGTGGSLHVVRFARGGAVEHVREAGSRSHGPAVKTLEARLELAGITQLNSTVLIKLGKTH